MEITEVRVRPALAAMGHPPALLAFATLTFDRCFAVHGIRLVQAGRGMLVAMPHHHALQRCGQCRRSNRVDANYCNWCGVGLTPQRAERLNRDVCFPIDMATRQRLTRAVIEAYQELTDAPNHHSDDASHTDGNTGNTATEPTRVLGRPEVPAPGGPAGLCGADGPAAAG